MMPKPVSLASNYSISTVTDGRGLCMVYQVKRVYVVYMVCEVYVVYYEV